MIRKLVYVVLRVLGSKKHNPINSDEKLALLVDNAVKIARFHREKCNEDCNCSMFLLGQLCIMAGAKLTKEQFLAFI